MTSFVPPETDEIIESDEPSGNPTFTPPATDKVIDSPKPSMAGGIARSLAQGASFGFADEAEAAIRALVDNDDGEDFSSSYRRNRDQVRQELELFREANPGIALTSEVIGGFAVPGFGAAKTVAKGATLAARVARGAAVGAGTGAVFGAGTAKEVEEVPFESTKGAAFGAGVGAALPLAGAAISTARSVASPSAGAARRIGQAVRRDGMTPDQIAGALDEAKKLGRPAKVADVGGSALRRELEVAAQSPGEAGQIVEKALAARNKQQLERLSRDLVKGTGVKSDTILNAIDSTMKTRSEAAKPVYKRAMDFSAEINDDIVNAWNQTTKTPLGKQALGKARKILNVENFDDAPLMERIDAFKRGLDDIIGASKRKGENAIARKALEVKDRLVSIVDISNPDYRNARQIWENGSNYLEAIDNGRKIMQPGVTASKLSQEFKSLTNAEQEAYRIGAVDSIITKFRQQSAKEPNLIKILRSPEMRDKLKAIMNPRQAERLDKILDLEDVMFATSAQALKGSQTAQRTAAMLEQQKQVGLITIADEITSLVIAPIRSLIVRGIPSLARGARERLLAKQNAIIARRLLSEVGDELTDIPTQIQPSGSISGALIPAVIAGEESP